MQRAPHLFGSDDGCEGNPAGLGVRPVGVQGVHYAAGCRRPHLFPLFENVLQPVLLHIYHFDVTAMGFILA